MRFVDSNARPGELPRKCPGTTSPDAENPEAFRLQEATLTGEDPRGRLGLPGPLDGPHTITASAERSTSLLRNAFISNQWSPQSHLIAGDATVPPGGSGDVAGPWEPLQAFGDSGNILEGFGNASPYDQALGLLGVDSQSSYVPVPLPHLISSTEQPPRSNAESAVSIRAEDTEPLRHFLTTMVQFMRMRPNQLDNIYHYIYTNLSLFHMPLYESILAWAALHLAQVNGSATTEAELRYERASALLFQDEDAAEHIELTLVTVWFLLQYELFLANGVERFISLLGYAADVVEVVFQGCSAEAIRAKFRPVTTRVLIWLCGYDGRAALFGNTCRLLRCLKLHPVIYDIIDAHGTNIAASCYEDELPATSPNVFYRLMLRLNVARSSPSLLYRLDGAQARCMAAWTRLSSDLEALRREIELNDSPAARYAVHVALGDTIHSGAVSTLEYNHMTLLARYYECMILYFRHRPTWMTDLEERFSPRIEECAGRIVRLARQVFMSRPNSPESIWPSTLFLAGIETTDPIYRDWIFGAFRLAESWRPNLKKTRLLLERANKIQKEFPMSYKVASLMCVTGDSFII